MESKLGRQYPAWIRVGGNQNPDTLHPRVRSPYHKFHSLTVIEGSRPPDNHRVSRINFHLQGQESSQDQTVRFFGLYLPPEINRVVQEVDEAWGEGDPMDHLKAWFKLGGEYVSGHLLHISRHPIAVVLAATDPSFGTRVLIPQPPENTDHRLEGIWVTDNAFAFLRGLSDRLAMNDANQGRAMLSAPPPPTLGRRWQQPS